MTMKYYLGIDGGGSKTSAAVCDERGKIIASAIGKTINFYSNPYETVRNNFREIIEKIGITEYESVFIGMSALSERADEKTALKLTNGILKAKTVIMDSDIAIALSASDCAGARAVLICGTGSMAAAITEDGKLIHAGGWGYLLGDEGSGYSIALNSVKKLLTEYDSGKTDDILFEKFRNFFGVSTDEDILNRFYDPPIARDEIASFCKVVFEAFRNGSKIAGSIIEKESGEAAVLAERLLSKLPDGTPFYLFGGVFEHNPEYIRSLSDKLPERFAKPVLLPYPPVIGAVIDAARNGGIEPDNNFFSNISEYKG